jgi:hypothetical protein
MSGWNKRRTHRAVSEKSGRNLRLGNKKLSGRNLSRHTKQVLLKGMHFKAPFIAHLKRNRILGIKLSSLHLTWCLGKK